VAGDSEYAGVFRGPHRFASIECTFLYEAAEKPTAQTARSRFHRAADANFRADGQVVGPNGAFHNPFWRWGPGVGALACKGTRLRH